jgi:hypothetical protein
MTANPKKKIAKKDSRKKWVREADKWASLDVRLDNKCVHQSADCKGDIVCGHLFSRVAYSTRWDERNLYCLCSYHNIRQEDDPVVAEALLEYARSLWGDAAIEELHRLYVSAYPVKTFEIEEHAAVWKGKYLKHLSWKGMK